MSHAAKCVQSSLTHTCAHTQTYTPTIKQDEPVAVSTLQRVLQDVLQGPVEKQDLLPAFRLPETSAALLGHAVERQQWRRILPHKHMGLFTHPHTHVNKTDTQKEARFPGQIIL